MSGQKPRFGPSSCALEGHKKKPFVDFGEPKFGVFLKLLGRMKKRGFVIFHNFVIAKKHGNKIVNGLCVFCRRFSGGPTCKHVPHTNEGNLRAPPQCPHEIRPC